MRPTSGVRRRILWVNATRHEITSIVDSVFAERIDDEGVRREEFRVRNMSARSEVVEEER